ncbi:glycosyltransferase [Arthrobacter sp. ISL-85]|uniref:glycosyltransferase n=1 Tax=Arthrobacter sp. ISL-85 TaxID=2819115 RepID=UPI001BEBC583|nr:glycosyltransferase [Arthrobacter sp. ISL-85]MBT2568956.1 glycosyltransferase [Arthrobacter sp. ISL-85]
MSALNFAAVVVHHRSPETLRATVHRLISEGLEPENVLVVDNSEEPGRVNTVRELLPVGVHIIFTPNSGYGAAVNRGVMWHKRNTSSTEYLLVSTHEALPEAGSLRKLEEVLDAHQATALVGPALITGPDSDVIWSLGGFFSKWLGLPKHFAHKAPISEMKDAEPKTVDWLDGAFLLFRRAVLEAYPLDEDFFLYMEETDHHQEIRRQGWEIRLEPAAVVWQSSGGTPAFYQTRNIQLFQAKNGSKLQALFSAPWIIAKTIIRDTLRRRGLSTWKPLLAGWKAGWLMQKAKQNEAKILLINPLGGALAHYTRALLETLDLTGADVRLIEINEPSISGNRRSQWLLSYLRLLAKSREFGQSRQNRVLVVWPVLGFLDLLLVRLLCGVRSSLIYHDPKPLVRAVGSSPLLAQFVFRLPSLPSVIVHSQAAAEAMQGLGFKSTLHLLAHPMLPPVDSEKDVRDRTNERPVVRVLGQYKRDRDLGVLVALAEELGSEADLEIIGRGWPSLRGWKVDPRFVSERELDGFIESSDAIVIPYLRFYQSGIALRALERKTPIVGRAATSLGDLYGPESKLLVHEDPRTGLIQPTAWAQAVRYAVRAGRDDAIEASHRYHEIAVSDWDSWNQASGPMTKGLWK